jgi:hypothetical protein
MSAFRILIAAASLLTLAGALYGFRENRWARYEREMQDPVDDPPDADVKAEFAFGRLRYRSPRDGYYRRRWGTDTNKSDRLFVQALRRLTRINAQSIEEVVNSGSDEVYDSPFLYAVAVGDWVLNADEAQRLRQFFERGGFLMVDDFHNEVEWEDFMVGIRKMFPNPKVIEIPNEEPIFHTVYDMTHRVQISGYNIVRGSPYERGGIVPHWRAILDDKDRIVVAAIHNQDIGDAWEFADAPEYPEKLASEAFRVGVNYVIYSMSH